MAVVAQPLGCRQTQSAARRIANDDHIPCASIVNEVAHYPPSGRHHLLRSPARSQRIDRDDTMRIRLLYQITDELPMAADNLVNVGAAMQEDYMMSGAYCFSGLDVIYRPTFGEAQINLYVAP
jgi:hypothetical protein